MKILVTGGYGFIGVNFIKYIISETSYKIINIDKLNYAGSINKKLIKIKHKNYEFIKNDLMNINFILKLLKKHKPEFIVHFAAESHVDRSINSPINFIDSNIYSTFNILEALKMYAKGNDTKLIHFSTDEVYGDTYKNKQASKENSVYNPSSPYSATKASSDLLVKAWSKTYGIQYNIINCVNNFGPYQNEEKMLPKIINCFITKKKIPVYGNGNQIREWIFVQDTAAAILKIIKRFHKNKTFNIGSNIRMKNIDLIRVVFKAMKVNNLINKNQNFQSFINYVKDRPGHDKKYFLNSNKFKKYYKFKNSNFSKSLNKTIKFQLLKDQYD